MRAPRRARRVWTRVRVEPRSRSKLGQQLLPSSGACDVERSEQREDDPERHSPNDRLRVHVAGGEAGEEKDKRADRERDWRNKCDEQLAGRKSLVFQSTDHNEAREGRVQMQRQEIQAPRGDRRRAEAGPAEAGGHSALRSSCVHDYTGRSNDA